MTNKRQIKKYVERMGSEIAQFILPAAVVTGAVTDEKAEDYITRISELQAELFSRLNIAFDKAPSAFPDMRKYRDAKRAYYHSAYNKALAEYEKGIQELLESLNKAVAK